MLKDSTFMGVGVEGGWNRVFSLSKRATWRVALFWFPFLEDMLWVGFFIFLKSLRRWCCCVFWGQRERVFGSLGGAGSLGQGLFLTTFFPKWIWKKSGLGECNVWS